MLFTLPLACSDDDDDDEEQVATGTCNGAAVNLTCSELEGSSEFIDEERQWCEDLGDTWSTEPCPTTYLLGCCREPFGEDWYLDCYYTGYTLTAMELEEQCILFEGAWTYGAKG